ncbi:MAG: hypothetical protein RIC55_28560 [Pirellulaceae bacterium]
MAESTPPHDGESDVTAHPESYGMTKEELAALSAEDSKAWKAVTGLLLLIVIGGVMLGALGVMIASSL